MKQKDLLESALSSLEGIHPAIPSSNVLSGIKQQLSRGQGASMRKLPISQLRLAAAGLALLFSANVLLITQWEGNREIDEDAYAATSLVDDYNLYSND
jgi:hypothetical protein